MTLSLFGFVKKALLASLLALGAWPTAAGAQTSKDNVEPRPALWLLADRDTKIYLFGTIHVLPPGFAWQSRALERAVRDADALAVETAEDPEPGVESLDLLRGMRLERPVPILQRVPAAKRRALKRSIKATGVPASTFDGLQTWAAAMALGMSQLLGSYGADTVEAAPGVEDVLQRRFREAGKPVLSVEEDGTVAAALSALPAPVQTAMLLDAIGEGGPAPQVAAMEDENVAWARGDAEALGIKASDGFPPALKDVLLRRRNAAWTEWLIDRLDSPGALLFAVGAAHLAGEDSVQRMLEARGFTVRRVD